MIPDLTIRPIDQWPAGWRTPGRQLNRKPDPFRSGYDDTLKLLRTELQQLDYSAAHLQLAVDSYNVRRDGMLRAGAKPWHPGVILTVVTPATTLVLRTDRFYSTRSRVEDWHVNLRAITLGLVDLRRLDRYGLTDGHAGTGAQYAGFRALPSGVPLAVGAAEMSPEEAAGLLCEATRDTIGEDPAELARVALVATSLWKEAAKTYHPDRGGDETLWKTLTQARDVLVAYASRRRQEAHT